MRVELDETEQTILLVDLLSMADNHEGTEVTRMDTNNFSFYHANSDSSYVIGVSDDGAEVTYKRVHGLDISDEVSLFVPWKNCVHQVQNIGGAITGITMAWALGAMSWNLQEVMHSWFQDKEEDEGESKNSSLNPVSVISYYEHLHDSDFTGFELKNPDTWPEAVWSPASNLALHSMFCSGIGNVLMQLPNDLTTYIVTDFEHFYERFQDYAMDMMAKLSSAFPDKQMEIAEFLAKITTNIMNSTTIVDSDDGTVHELVEIS